MLKRPERRLVNGKLVLSIGLVVALGATQFGRAVSQQPTPPGPAGSVMRVAAVGDVHGEGASPAAVATATLAAQADFILGLGDYQYEDGAMEKYNYYFDTDWGPLVPKIFPVFGPHHDQDWTDTDPLKYFNGGGAHGYKSPVTLQPYTPYSFDRGAWHFIALPDVCARLPQCRMSDVTAWLEQDLATHPNQCTIAYWHQPYFTSIGKHRPEESLKPWVELLAAKHVDVVLQGHNHFYERFAPQNAAREADPLGVQAFVVGTGGVNHHNFRGTAPNSVTHDNSTYGVLELTLRDDSYDWEFVPVAGGTYTDRGSMTCR